MVLKEAHNYNFHINPLMLLSTFNSGKSRLENDNMFELSKFRVYN